MSFMRNSGAFFGGSFDSKPGKNKIQGVIKSIMEPEIETKVRKVIELDNRTIHSIIQIMAIKNENQAFLTVEMFPIVLVVEEKDKKYVISLTENEIDEDEFIKMISSKK